MIHQKWWQLTPKPTTRSGSDSGPSFDQSGFTAISWWQLVQPIGERAVIYRRLETEPTVTRSIVIHIRKFLPTFHSPAMGSGRHHLAVKSPPAAGRIYRIRQSLGLAVKKDDAPNKHKLCQCLIAGGRQPYRLRDPLIGLALEGYGWVDSVRVAGLKKSQIAMGKMGVKSENIGGKAIMVRDAGELSQNATFFVFLRQSGKERGHAMSGAVGNRTYYVRLNSAQLETAPTGWGGRRGGWKLNLPNKKSQHLPG